MDGTVLHKKQAILDGNFKVPRLASASNGYECYDYSIKFNLKKL